ncbi:hypothetical protein ALT1644_130026 [Alteromonas macleodii]
MKIIALKKPILSDVRNPATIVLP